MIGLASELHLLEFGNNMSYPYSDQEEKENKVWDAIIPFVFTGIILILLGAILWIVFGGSITYTKDGFTETEISL